MTTLKTRAALAVAEYDQLMEARARHNSGMARHIPIEDHAQAQRKLIQRARWELAQGWVRKASATLGEVRI